MTLGIFDSGEGGHNLLRHARLRNNRDDVLFLCDRARAPYGTKREYELLGIVDDNIRRLRSMGAERIIIACCTACTVFDRLSDTDGVYPIIPLTARAAAAASDGSIAVIATGRTVSSGAFRRAINDPQKEVKEIEAQTLVELVERGACDENATPELYDYLTRLLARAEGADTLILGCTHFSSVASTALDVGKRYGIRRVIDAARIGAQLIPAAFDADGDGVDYIFNTVKTKHG